MTPIKQVTAAVLAGMGFSQAVHTQEALQTEAMTHWWDRSAWENPDRSYQWYPPERVAPPATDSPLTPPPPPPRKSIRELTTTKDIREELDRLKDEAVINPTKENVRTYLEAQQYVMGKGSTFADMARRVVWETAELDYSLRRPTNALAIDAFKSSRRDTRDQAIARLARESGLFFFFRGDCPYCHQLAPILKYLQDVHGIEVFPVSLDGRRMPQFPHAYPDNGISRVLEVAQVPALFLSSKLERRVQPIGYGVLAADEILERMYVLTQTKPGEDF
jgi:conjugal transfer pilus assembly protein TraF